MVLYSHRNEWANQASGLSCVPEWKVMKAVPWITTVRLACHRSPWFIPSRRDQPWGEVRCIKYSAESCSAVPALTTITHLQVEPCLPKNIYTQRNDRYTKRNIVFNLKVISSSYPFVFLKPRKSENCKKKKKKNLISNVIHLYGRLAGWFKWVKNSCRGQSAGEVVLSWRRQGWVEGEVIKWFHRNSYLQEK